MRNHINLITEAAQFRTIARSRLRLWALVWAATALVLLPMGLSRWRERRVVVQRHEALQAAYEPTRRLSHEIGALRAEAKTLVETKQIALELSGVGSPTVLLGAVGRAAGLSKGELYAREISISQTLPGDAQGEDRGRAIIKAAATPFFDVTEFVDALDRSPVTSVSVLASELLNQEGIEQKEYTLECVF